MLERMAVTIIHVGLLLSACLIVAVVGYAISHI